MVSRNEKRVAKIREYGAQIPECFGICEEDEIYISRIYIEHTRTNDRYKKTDNETKLCFFKTTQ